MSRKTIAGIAFVWVLSLVSVAVWAQDLTPVPTIPEGQPIGAIITAENIGFQRTASMPSKDGKVVGKWMVKVNGKWVETQAPVGVVRGGGSD
jgi:hypothetical protein